VEGARFITPSLAGAAATPQFDSYIAFLYRQYIQVAFRGGATAPTGEIQQ
jgi:hypothetical protein